MIWLNRQLFFLVLLAPLFAQPAIAGESARVDEVEFVSHGARLSGSMVYPQDGKIRAAIVFIHGSGAHTRNMKWAERFAGHGIAALIYDKRGAAKSGGNYEGEQSVSEKNISLLADDAVAAFNALEGHPSIKGSPAGFAGISQAGWIAPLAAQRSGRAKFLVL